MDHLLSPVAKVRHILKCLLPVVTAQMPVCLNKIPTADCDKRVTSHMSKLTFRVARAKAWGPSGHHESMKTRNLTVHVVMFIAGLSPVAHLFRCAFSKCASSRVVNSNSGWCGVFWQFQTTELCSTTAAVLVVRHGCSGDAAPKQHISSCRRCRQNGAGPEFVSHLSQEQDP